MASKTRIVGLDIAKMRETMLNNVVTQQNANLIDYAKKRVIEIGDTIQSRGYKMDRTGNLLDSLCWFVSYGAKVIESGFYRQAVATRDSYLHELFEDDFKSMFPIHGRKLARMFVREWGAKYGDGWCVAFAILAPYWGYWEVGHKNVLTKKRERFAIMAEFWDTAKNDLQPMVVAFYRSRPHYTRQKLEKMSERFNKNPYAEKRHFDRYPIHY